MKQCYCCKETKLFSDFTKDKSKSDGLKIYCKSCANEKKQQWRNVNKDKVAAYDKQWQEQNKDKKSVNYKRWQQNNRGYVNAYNSKRRADEKAATPSWADLDKIKSLYNVAQYFDWISGGFVKHHVDHIVPLRGKNVCGLHVENNLQILIDKDNLRKSNNYGCEI